MNAYLTVALGLFALVAFSDGVTVKVGEFSFPLESVKQLKYLLDAMPKSPRLRLNNAVYICGNPRLPAEFKPLCSSPKAIRLIRQLESIARDPVVCEICANVACSGC